MITRLRVTSFLLLSPALAGGALAQGLPGRLAPHGVVGLSPHHAELLAAHNADRRRVGLPDLVWDPLLAAGAQGYARELALRNVLRHSPKATRRGQGENLWIGSRGAFRPAMMVATWSAERIHFRPGPFPAVSRTGNWADVGHYTQMIWPRTRRLGCGIAASARFDLLVCRYSPSGNVDGQRVP